MDVFLNLEIIELLRNNAIFSFMAFCNLASAARLHK